MKRKYYFLIGIAALLVYSALVEPYWVVRKTYDITVPGLRTERITVVHIADIHTTRLGRREWKTLRMIEEIDPDFVFITGDLLKSHSKIASGLAFLSGIKSRYGTYVVLGNADSVLEASIRWGRTPKDSLDYHILINENLDCGAFQLVGLDDPVGHREDVEKAFAGVNETKPVLVLSHFHPDSLIWDLEAKGADLILSGHTHGGHVGFAAVVGLVPYAYRSRYLAGLYSLGNLQLCVTRGVGTNVFPLRFLCRPEIVVVNLEGE